MTTHTPHNFGRLLAAATCVCLLAGCLAAASASAAYEQIGCFAGSLPGLTESCEPVEEEKFGEEVQLGGIVDMAVNYTGAGGVPKGTVYAIGEENSFRVHVSMFVPTTDGGLDFRQRWEVKPEGESYERCGPDGELSHPNCSPVPEGGIKYFGIAVDQGSGNVYVLNGTGGEPSAGSKNIIVYSPGGSSVITSFGEYASGAIADSPGKLHAGVRQRGALEVGDGGTVYVSDTESGNYHRFMVFEPETPGSYDKYVYAGEELTGSTFAGSPFVASRDASGNIYAVTNGLTEIQMYAPQEPGPYPGPAAVAVCSFKFTKGGILSLTVNPLTGEAFFYSYKQPKRVRRLGPCDPGTGKFTELEPEPEALTVAPERDELWALAFDPLRQVDPDRPAGVIYGAAANGDSNNVLGDGDPTQSALGYVFARGKESPPEVKAQSVAHVTAGAALLRANIDPHGYTTTWAFQYIAAADYEANPPEERFAGALEAPTGGGVIPAANGGQPVAAAVSGLTADTEYRFRVVATSDCGADNCADAGEALAFRTFPAQPKLLPDNRSYELVSPSQKQGGQVLPASYGISTCNNCKPGEGFTRFPVRSRADGDAISYEATNLSGVQGAPFGNLYVAHRDPLDGWTSDAPTPSTFVKSSVYLALDRSLTEALLLHRSPQLVTGTPANYLNLYGQPIENPLALEPLLAAPPTARTPEDFVLRFAGASDDLSRVFFAANDAFTPEDPGIAPPAPAVGVKQFNLYEWNRGTGDLALVSVLPGNSTAAPDSDFALADPEYPEVGPTVISRDGSRAFWTSSGGQLYVRVDGSETREIPDSGRFLAASPDGSKVLLTNGRLWDTDSMTSVDLTSGQGGFVGLVGNSDDLSDVYFVDKAALTPGAEPLECKPFGSAISCNLYHWHDGTTALVATLLPADNSDTYAADWNPSPGKRTAQASPHGRYLAFVSAARLTGYDNTGPHCKVVTVIDLQPGPCLEVYLFDSADGTLLCASCNPSLATPLDRSALTILEGPTSQQQPEFLSDSGRLFFDSRDSLSPFDANEGVEDVYEYEPQGVGTCKRAGGCVSLISAGTGPYDSNFLAADPSGKNVFFTTRDQLVGTDRDGLIDLYDARENGGIPTSVEPSECQGEACQPPFVLPPSSPPATSVISGGEIMRHLCPKGKVRRKGRCVKKQRDKKSRSHHRGRQHATR